MSTTLNRRILRIYNNGLTKQVFDPATNSVVTVVALTKRDDVEVQIALTDTNSITPLDPVYKYPKTGTEVDVSGCTFKLGVKTKANYDAEGSYSLISQSTNPSSTWQNLSLGRISMLLIPALLAADSYKLELEITTATGKKITTLLLDLTIVQDLNIGDEGSPTPSSPTYYTAAETDVLLDDLSSLAGLYVVQYPFPLQVLDIDAGQSFEKDATAFKLSGFCQVAPQGQSVFARLTKNGIPLGDQLEIRQGENTGEADITDIDFLTTDELGVTITQIGTGSNPGQNLRVRVHFKRKV